MSRLTSLKPRLMTGQALAIGIDFGTTNTCVGVWDNNHFKLIPNLDKQGTYLFPSCVAIVDDETRVGSPAKDHAHHHPNNTIYCDSIKRLIGRLFSESSVTSDIKRWPFRVVEGQNSRPTILIKSKGIDTEYHAEQICAMVLKKIKDMATIHLGSDIKDAVITVPAYFNDSQRQATIHAGELAGLNVLQILDEPTAAALAYGFDKITSRVKKYNVLVFHLGGGTFDVSILGIEGKFFQVKGISGDSHLGGDGFDNCLMDYFIEEFKTKNKTDISENVRELSKLRKACEDAKVRLSACARTPIIIDIKDIRDDHFISRVLFEKLSDKLFKECMKIVDACLKKSKMEKEDIDKVLLVGGSTRIPMVKKLLMDYFGKEKICQTINPDEAVAHGAAIFAAKLSGLVDKSVLELNVTSITPLSIGIEVIEGVMSIVVPRCTQIPTKLEKEYTTVVDNQTEIALNVYQGERTRVEDNLFLGKSTVKGITPAPKQDPIIIVCFEIDGNGVLQIRAEERTSGSQKKITVTKSNKITVTKENKITVTKEVEKIFSKKKGSRENDETPKRTRMKNMKRGIMR